MRQNLWLALILAVLAVVYLTLPDLRLVTAVVIGLVYFLYGIIIHLTDKSLHLLVVLEYLFLSFLGTAILIFISYRA
ncbi:MAG: hypothetical protein UX85_C0005G0070 [Candidatus Beckwithbacteria bacterium GW2011_GWB1_47_15]|uniref:Uncharacterized protein n=1 Tax=Candidatus Beckwithbacteria bacterium GW2011_GWB1_47_15 TaxID=1618371 RepID=A0A0G1RV55_9BACT|nr:MAG: hypothetical protein UY43_C0001G0800 [Candidatus Beckwithbacteria bacterium GW2011_GWC1_49_16]KKU35778.1 MAG: hypothetical protein UX50_C0002G0205 [Candidatus Beckwithbacteria bacterium GW2011_GWA1_46_30]KKU61032.1 MAG: hypothetical protein UX85_C0005G0070 [Candidatus Beckwithbacteria bacterium GW2011_GWB1_47_15]KKU72337.1 MAG: hypothetical protein UX97_C0001G0207 [Candidatus Beckwithbacteria bacterium GW2011_GWA2_47_25]KKW04903.1 MAG: hypothetical protein UY37_C0001G0007 [Candidatus Be